VEITSVNEILNYFKVSVTSSNDRKSKTNEKKYEHIIKKFLDIRFEGSDFGNELFLDQFDLYDKLEELEEQLREANLYITLYEGYEVPYNVDKVEIQEDSTYDNPKLLVTLKRHI